MKANPSEKIKRFMAQKGLKQAGLAVLLGVNQGTVSRLLSGKRSLSLPLAVKLRKTIGIDPSEWPSKQERS